MALPWFHSGLGTSAKSCNIWCASLADSVISDRRLSCRFMRRRTASVDVSSSPAEVPLPFVSAAGGGGSTTVLLAAGAPSQPHERCRGCAGAGAVASPRGRAPRPHASTDGRFDVGGVLAGGIALARAV